MGIDGNLIVRGGLVTEADKHTGKMPCEHEDRNWHTASEAKEHQRMSADRHKLQLRHGTDTPLQSSEENNTANTWTVNFSPPEIQVNTLLLLQPPSLWWASLVA